MYRAPCWDYYNRWLITASAWAYVFFIDIDGHQDDKNVTEALNELQQQAALFKILGSYPKASL
jgi:prephenate dehydratase